MLLLAGLLAPPGARAAELFTIDPRFGRIEFTVSHLGLFSSHGAFTRFDSRLLIDPQHPERTRITVVVDAGSVAMTWQDAAALLRSPAFFDVARYPEVRFSSTAVVPLSADHYTVRGTLEIRGVTRPIDLDAVLTDRGTDPVTKTEVADFIVQGQLRRTAFGMIADRTFISDRVNIRIAVRIQLAELHAG